MTIQEANKLLDMSKDGVSIPGGVLDEALFMTGERNSSHDSPNLDIEDFVAACGSVACYDGSGLLCGDRQADWQGQASRVYQGRLCSDVHRR